MYPEKTTILTNTNIPMFTAVLFTRVWTWRQHRYPLADKCIKKSTGVYIERIEYYSAIKKRRFESVLVR